MLALLRHINTSDLWLNLKTSPATFLPVADSYHAVRLQRGGHLCMCFCKHRETRVSPFLITWTLPEPNELPTLLCVTHMVLNIVLQNQWWASPSSYPRFLCTKEHTTHLCACSSHSDTGLPGPCPLGLISSSASFKNSIWKIPLGGATLTCPWRKFGLEAGNHALFFWFVKIKNLHKDVPINFFIILFTFYTASGGACF